MYFYINRISMKLLIYLFLFVSTLSLSSCNKDEKLIVVTTPWENPHTQLFLLKGTPQEVCKTIFQEEEFLQATLSHYDKSGNLICYNPAYLPASENMGATKSLDWGSNADSYSEYRYEYDGVNRLVGVTKLSFGEEVDRFEFHYSDHGKYVPMPLPLGKHQFYLLKNLSAVVSANDGEIFTCDGSQAVLSQRSFLSQRTVTFSFNERFPVAAIDVSERDGQELSRVNIEYEYNNAGYLIAIYYIERGDVPVYTTYRYSDTHLLNMVSLSVVSNGSSNTYNYKYNTEGWLHTVGLKPTAELQMLEGHTYTHTDEYGNWTRDMRSGMSYSAPHLPEGTLIYLRDIAY